MGYSPPPRLQISPSITGTSTRKQPTILRHSVIRYYIHSQTGADWVKSECSFQSLQPSTRASTPLCSITSPSNSQRLRKTLQHRYNHIPIKERNNGTAGEAIRIATAQLSIFDFRQLFGHSFETQRLLPIHTLMNGSHPCTKR
jgi:hypothetical protein